MAALGLFLALLLALSAGHKLVARAALAPVAARLAGAAPVLGLPLLLTAAATEALAAMALLVPGLAAVGALGAAGLWSLYAVALWRRRGQALDCGCDLVRRVRPVTPAMAARPLLLASAAVAVALLPAAPFTLETPFAALALLALWLAAAELAALPSLAHRRHA
jgi:hypothetical protein